MFDLVVKAHNLLPHSILQQNPSFVPLGPNEVAPHLQLLMRTNCSFEGVIGALPVCGDALTCPGTQMLCSTTTTGRPRPTVGNPTR